MNKRNLALVSAMLVATLAAMPATSFARPGHGHGHKHGHGGSSVRFGLHIGVPLAIGAASWHYGYGVRHGYGVSYYTPAPYSYYYYPSPTPIIVNPAPVTYIEQSPPVAASGQSNGYWYYCDGAKAYYPYVKECPAGWQPVPSTPNR